MSKYIKVFEPGSPEYVRLEAAADIMSAMSPNGWRYYVDVTWFDFGQGWKWTTILCDGAHDSYQALYPADQERILEADDLEAAAAKVFAGRFCPDRADRYIITYALSSGTDGVEMTTYWATMARNELDAKQKFEARFPDCAVRSVELADENKRSRYGNGWYTDEERASNKAKLDEYYATERDERQEAELTAGTYELDEFTARIAYEDRRASENTPNLEGVHVGDMFYVMWGWEQTNYSFFQVVELRGKHTVIVRENECVMAPYGNMLGLSRPIRDKFRDDRTFTLRTRYDEHLGELWINAPEGCGSGHSLRRCEDGRLFEYSSYA